MPGRDVHARTIACAGLAIGLTVAAVIVAVFLLLRHWDLPPGPDRVRLPYEPVPQAPALQSAPQPDLAIPGEPFSFGTLELAQAVGDFGALDASRRRAMHAHLPRPDAALLNSLGDALFAARRP